MRNWIILFVVAIETALLAIGAMGEAADSTVAATATHYVGDTVKLADSEWTVLAAKDMGGVLPGEMDEKHTAGRFIAVQFAVKNTTGETLEIVGQPILIDAKGQRFKELSGIESYLPDGTNNTLKAKIKPGITKKFIEIYDVPKDVTGLSFQIHTLSDKPDSFALVSIGI